MKLLPKAIETRRNEEEEEEEEAQLKSLDKWQQWEAWKKNKRMVRSKLQSKPNSHGMQEEEDGEERVLSGSKFPVIEMKLMVLKM